MTQQSKKQTMEESRKIWAQIDPLTKRRNEITARKHQIFKLIKELLCINKTINNKSILSEKGKRTRTWTKIY